MEIQCDMEYADDRCSHGVHCDEDCEQCLATEQRLELEAKGQQRIQFGQ